MEFKTCNLRGGRLRDGTPVITCNGVRLDPTVSGGPRFEWGNSDVGEMPDARGTTALSILGAYSADLGWAVRHYKAFQRNVISQLDESSWYLYLSDTDRSLIEGGQYATLNRTDGLTVLVRGATSYPNFFSAPPPVPPPAPLSTASRPRPRVHYYRLERPDCGECGCPADRSDIKLVTYSVMFAGKWVRGAALCDPRDPSSRKAGREVAKQRLADFFMSYNGSHIVLPGPPGIKIFAKLEWLKAEEELIRETEQDAEVTRNERSRFYHDVFDDKISVEITDKIVKRDSVGTGQIDGATVGVYKPTVEPEKFMFAGAYPVRYRAGMDFGSTKDFVVVNVHAHDGQAPAADPDFPTNHEDTNPYHRKGEF